MGWKLSDLFPTSPRLGLKVEDKAPVEKEVSQCPPLPYNIFRGPSSEVKAALADWEILTTARDLSSSGPLPCVSDPKLSLETILRKGTYHLKIKKGIKKKDLFRFLLAKMLYEEEEGLHIDEFLVLWELYLQLEGLLEKDPSFREKYGAFFENTFYFFQMLASSKEFPIRVEQCETPEYLKRISSVLEPMLPSRSAYFGLKGQKSLRSGFSLVFQDEILVRKIAPGRRIGVGYRDKGSRRDPAVDGSPDWREVALSHQERRISEVEYATRVPRESLSFDWDLVYNSSRPLPGELFEEDCPPDPDELNP